MVVETPILPAHIETTVQSIAELHAQHHREASAVQRTVDRLTSIVARPRFIGVITAAIAFWVIINLLLQLAGHPAIDPAPFNFLQGVGTIGGLYITILILITQKREDQLIQAREQLTLELAILGEQKNAKIIQLLEELRRDHPTIKNRYDPEAEALSVPADPQMILDAIKETQQELLVEVTSTSDAEIKIAQDEDQPGADRNAQRASSE